MFVVLRDENWHVKNLLSRWPLLGIDFEKACHHRREVRGESFRDRRVDAFDDLLV